MAQPHTHPVRLGKAFVLTPRRTTVLDAIQREPALSTVELWHRTRQGWGTLLHHLRTLERAGWIRSRRYFRARRWVPTGDPKTMNFAIANRDPRNRRLFQRLRESGPTRITTLASALPELTRQAVSHRVRHLEHLGTLTVHERGREHVVSLAANADGAGL